MKTKQGNILHLAVFFLILTENTRLTLEVYNKEYDNFPLDPTSPSLFILDELYYRYGFFFNHDKLVDSGKSYSRGIELMIQKKLAKDFYGLISGSNLIFYFSVWNIYNQKNIANYYWNTIDNKKDTMYQWG